MKKMGYLKNGSNCFSVECGGHVRRSNLLPVERELFRQKATNEYHFIRWPLFVLVICPCNFILQTSRIKYNFFSILFPIRHKLFNFRRQALFSTHRMNCSTNLHRGFSKSRATIVWNGRPYDRRRFALSMIAPYVSHVPASICNLV